MPSPLAPNGSRGRSDAASTIEFLAPDERAFLPRGTHRGEVGGGGPSPFVGFDETGFDGRTSDSGPWDDADGADLERSPRSRWVPVAAGVAVVALLIVGVVAAAPWSDDEASPPPTTATEGTARDGGSPPVPGVSTPIAPLTTAVDAPAPGVAGWVLDPPIAGLTAVTMVDDASDPTAVGSDLEPGGWGEVWATDGATRTSGRWFSITLLPFVPLEPIAPGWIANAVDGQPAQATRDRDGVVRLRFERGQIDAPRLVTIDAAGFSLPELIELADSVGIVDDRPQLADDRPRFDRPELLDGLDRMAARATDRDLIDATLLGSSPTSGVYYEGPARDDVTLLQLRPPGDVDAALVDLAFSTAATTLDPQTDFDGFVPDLVTVGTRRFDGIDLHVVRWIVGDDDVWLLTTLAPGVLRAMVDDARRVTPGQWAVQRDAIIRTPRLDLDDGPAADVAVEVGAGTTDDGERWTVYVRPLTGRLVVTVDGVGQTQTSLERVVGRAGVGAIGTVVVGRSTLVVAASATGPALLRVSPGSGAERSVELAALPTVDDEPTEPGRLDPSFWTSWSGVHVGVVAVGAPARFVAEIVAGGDTGGDTGGDLVTTFDPWGTVATMASDGEP